MAMTTLTVGLRLFQWMELGMSPGLLEPCHH
jgi:hypothetical protein